MFFGQRRGSVNALTIPALDQEADSFKALRRYPPDLVRQLLVQSQRRELAAGLREQWVQQNRDQFCLLRSTVAERTTLNPDATVEAYLDYRLLLRPLAYAMLALYGQDREFSESYTAFENEAALSRLHQEGRGAIVAGRHFGPHSAIAFILASRGYRVTGVMPREEAGLFERLRQSYCPALKDRTTILTVPDRSLLFKCRAKLRQGEVIVMFMEFSKSDAPARTQVQFLGRTLPAPEGPAFLAAVTGAALIPARVLHQGEDSLRVVFDDPMTVAPRRRGGLECVAQRLWSDLEHQVLAQPEQWLGWEVLARDLPAAVRQ